MLEIDKLRNLPNYHFKETLYYVNTKLNLLCKNYYVRAILNLAYKNY